MTNKDNYVADITTRLRTIKTIVLAGKTDYSMYSADFLELFSYYKLFKNIFLPLDTVTKPSKKQSYKLQSTTFTCVQKLVHIVSYYY